MAPSVLSSVIRQKEKTRSSRNAPWKKLGAGVRGMGVAKLCRTMERL